MNPQKELLLRQIEDRVVNKKLINKAVEKKLNLYFMPRDSQGCGFYRMLLPASTIKDNNLANVEINPNFNKKLAEWANVIIVQRATEPDFYEFFEYVQAQGKIIIYEIDDLIYGVHKNNQAYEVWNPQFPRTARALRLMSMANYISVTTERLANEYCTHNKNIFILPNYLDKELWDAPRGWKAHDWDHYYMQKGDNLIRIGWMGGASHQSDLEMIAPILIRLSRKYKNVKIVLMGYDAYDIFSKIPLTEAICPHCCNEGQLQIERGVGILEYPAKLKSLAFDIGIAPLVETAFNECKCVTGNTLINTENGLERIESIVKHRKNNEQIATKSKLKVINSDANNNILTHFYSKKEKTVKIITQNGYCIEGTKTHRILSDKEEWKPLLEIKIGDPIKFEKIVFSKKMFEMQYNFWASRVGTLVDGEDIPIFKLTEKYAEIIGAIIGDGHVAGSISIACDKQDKDVIEHYTELVSSLGFKPRQWDEKNANCRYVGFSSMPFKNILISLGVVDNNIKKNFSVPDCIFKSPQNVVSKFLSALFDTDGCVKRSGIQFSTKSYKLAHEVQLLLLGFGIKSRVSATFSKIYSKNYYRVDIGRIGSEIFQKEIGFISIRKKILLKEVLSKNRGNNIGKNEFIDFIKKIEHSENTVYDITVENSKWYVGNGIVNHNSDIKLKEFSALGIPVVASNIKPYNVSLKHGVTGYLASNGKEWFDYLELLVQDKELRVKLGKNALRWYEENTIDRHIHKWVEAYSQAVNRIPQW